MRMTQMIGLNKYAMDLVKDAYQIEKVERMTLGMFDEDIPGRVYYVKPSKGEDVNEYYKYTEVKQCSPWSSGPMIFTHLKWEIKKKSGQMLDMGFVCSWICDPGIVSTHGEVDVDTGRFYV